MENFCTFVQAKKNFFYVPWSVWKFPVQNLTDDDSALNWAVWLLQCSNTPGAKPPTLRSSTSSHRNTLEKRGAFSGHFILNFCGNILPCHWICCCSFLGVTFDTKLLMHAAVHSCVTEASSPQQSTTVTFLNTYLGVVIRELVCCPIVTTIIIASAGVVHSQILSKSLMRKHEIAQIVNSILADSMVLVIPEHMCTYIGEIKVAPDLNLDIQ